MFCVLLNRVLLAVLLASVTSAAGTEDLYKLLGVDKKATIQEIKSAYRRKARDTHPDKNKGVPPEESAEQFRQVVHAFETLSDEGSRKRYDKTGRHDDSPGSNYNSWNNWQWSGQQRRGSGGGGGSFHWHFQQPRKLKDKFEVQEAMSRVLHIVSLDQLKTIMLNENDVLERNILMVAFTPPLEKHLDEEMVFPYPFAAMSSQGIWWEDLLQTVKIRYNKANELSRFFSLPTGDELTKGDAPMFMYGKKGDPLDKVTSIKTRDRELFEKWAWEQIQVKVLFINQHDHPVEIYWIHGSRAHSKEVLQPGTQIELTTMLTHEWYIRDKRVDARPDSPGSWKLTDESSLLTLKFGVENGPKIRDDWTTTVVIPRRTCFDLSGHCLFWNSQGECRKNPVFMEEVCQLTCKQCENDKPTSFDHNVDDETDANVDVTKEQTEDAETNTGDTAVNDEL